MNHPKPRILIVDIETSFDILASYGIREQYHNPDNILQDWYMICFRYKWHGGQKLYSHSVLDDMNRFKKNCADDYVVVKAMHKLMQDVDAVVGHNVENFDWKMFYARVMYYRLPPLAKPLFIDTMKEAAKLARFNSKSLKYLARYFKIKPKSEHSRKMGLNILRGQITATRECVAYCGRDIETTEELLDVLLPYMRDVKVNANIWRADGIECCPNPACGSTSLLKRGFKITRTGKYQSYQCKECGSWAQGKKSVKRAPIK